MFDFTACRGHGFEVLTQSSGTQAQWRGSLTSFFHVARRLIDWTSAEIRCGRLREPASLLGRLECPGWAKSWRDFAIQLDRLYPLELVSPFEGVASISGAVWRGADVFNEPRDDGLAKLCFDAGTFELPIHVHESSDRCILILEGSGTFYLSNETLPSFTGDGVRSVAVEPGNLLVFTRGLLHTFGAGDRPLVMLSYHAPAIPFDDPRQYTLPAIRWLPPASLSIATSCPDEQTRNANVPPSSFQPDLSCAGH